jgi:hypothetical protein
MGVQQNSGVGSTDVWLKDVAIVRGDWSVLPIFTGSPITMTICGGGVVGSMRASYCGGYRNA